MTQREFDFQAQRDDEQPYDRPFHHDGPDTEKEAAESMVGIAATIRNQILLAVDEHALTQDEYSATTGRARHAISPRFTELERRGWIAKSDERRLTRSGRAACVYAVTVTGALRAAQLREQGMAA